MWTPQTRLRVLRGLTRIPPLTNERVRARILKAYKAGKWERARLAERLGSRRFSSPALAGIDIRLAKLLADGGVFVEAGANDGFRQSNTYYLERFRGWTGVLVEPIPQLADLARKRRVNARVFNCALVASAFPADTVTVRYGDLISGIGSEVTEASWGWERAYDVEVAARTLTSVLDEAGVEHVDLLSLDVEGYEWSVLGGLDLERFAPRMILLELVERDLAPLGETLPGYEVHEWLTERDVLLRRATQADTRGAAGRSDA